MVAVLFGGLALSNSAFAGVETEKVTICHVPPGNPDKSKTISVDPESASEHLAEHEGDYEGECGDEPEPFCGDGLVNQISEVCDDGNNIDGDGCDSSCQIETTGPTTCDECFEIFFEQNSACGSDNVECEVAALNEWGDCSLTCEGTLQGYSQQCVNESSTFLSECSAVNEVEADLCFSDFQNAVITCDST